MENSRKTLAAGCFGKVYKRHLKDGTLAAVKEVPLEYISKEKLKRECNVYYNARHPNVVKLIGDPWIQDSMICIPMEFIAGEDLETTIFKTQISKIQLTPAVKATIITGMCEGLLYLHSKNIVHQDLKPDNIMVEHQTHRAVIIDMGLAKFFRNGFSSAPNTGNKAYSAPEIRFCYGVRDKRSDVWAMGKIIAELCARIRLPTQYVSAGKIQETLRDQTYCHPVSRMVEDNPYSRASMAAVISDIRRAAFASQMIVRPHLQGAEKPLGGLFHQKAGHHRMAQVHPVDLNHEMSCHGKPPQFGKVRERRYNLEKKCVEVVNTVTKDGKIIDRKVTFEYN